MFTSQDGKDGELSKPISSGVNIASYYELFDHLECPIRVLTSGNYT